MPRFRGAIKMNEPLWQEDQPEDKVFNLSFLGSRGFIVILALIALFLGGSILYYVFVAGGFSDYNPTDVPAHISAIKERPENPGGFEVPHQDKNIFENLVRDENNRSEQTLLMGNDMESPVVSTVMVTHDNGEKETIVLHSDGQVEVEDLGQASVKEVIASTDDHVNIIKDMVPSESMQQPAPSSKNASAPTPAYKPFTAQLGSLTSESLAEKQWQFLKRKFSGLLKGQEMHIKKASVPGKGTFYRIHVGSFDVQEQAQDFCTKLLDQGTACLAVKA